MNISPTRRRRELVAGYVNRAREHNGMLLLVSGLPGTGKSHLLRDLGTLASQERHPHHYVAADELERDIPFAFVERIMSSGFGDSPSFDAGTPPIDVARALINALTDLPRGELRTLLLDDAQWIDEESSRALRFVAPRTVRRGVLIAVAARPPFEKGSLTATLRDYAHASPSHEHHQIEPLTADDIRALALERFGTGIAPRTAESLRDASGGTFLGINVLFDNVTASEARNLHLSWGVPVRGADLPESPFLTGYSKLSSKGRLAAELASIAGREIPTRVLKRAALALGDSADIGSACHAGVLIESDFGATIATTHSLIASAIRSSLDDARAKRLYRALADQTEGYASITYALRGAEGWDSQLATRVHEFVHDAASQGHVAAVDELLRAALDIAAGEEREQLVMDLALLHVWHKTGFAVLDLFDDIMALPESPIRDCLVVVLLAYRFDREGALRLIQKALTREAGDADTLTVQSFLVFMSAIFSMRSADQHLPTDLVALGKRIWQHAPEDPSALSDRRLAWMVSPREYETILDGYGIVALHVDYRTDEVVAVLPGLVERALALPDSDLKVDALVPLAGAAVAVGDITLAHSLAETGVEIVRGLMVRPWAAGTIQVIHAHTLALLGRLREAERVVAETQELSYDYLDVETRFTLAAMHAWLRAMMGLPGADSALEEAQRLEGLPWEAYATDIVVMATCEIARVADDSAAILTATEHERVKNFRSTQRGFLTYRARALLDSGRGDEARELIDTLAQWRGTRWQETWGTLASLRARLAHVEGEFAEAERLYLEAIDHDASASPLSTALAYADLGTLLVERARENEAEQAYRRAVRLLEGIGAFGYVANVSARLSTITDRGRNERATRVRTLTSREREVARSLAEGASNAQISTALFVSPATARFHVSNVLRKLGASRRTEVAGLVADVIDLVGP